MPRNTQTVLNDSEGNNRTATHLSTNIVIVVANNVVGAVQDLTVNESRAGIKMIDEVGTDGHIDSAPSGATSVEGTCSRVRFDRIRMAEAFSRGFVHVKSQRIPFDMEIHDRFHDGDPNNAIVTVVKNVWISKISYSYKAEDFIITESMDWKAEDIYSVINTNNNVVPAGGVSGRAFPVAINPFEREADRSGEFRGALDAPGLLNAFLGD